MAHSAALVSPSAAIASDQQTNTAVGHLLIQRLHIPIGQKLDVRYGPVMIGAKEFLLPLAAEDIGPFYKTQTKSEIRFQQYRKYESNSSINFGEGEIKHEDPVKR